MYSHQVKFSLLVVLFISFGLEDLYSQTYSGLWSDEQEQKINKMVERWDNQTKPGAAVLVMNNGKPVYKKCFGLADVENKIPIKPSTIFPLADLSSHFTAVATFVLIDKGLLSLDTPITKYLSDMPDFVSKVSIKDLLQHSSGIDDFNRLNVLAGGQQDEVLTQDIALKLLRSQKNILFQPGSRTQDSAGNMLLLAEVIDSVSNKGFARFMREDIFEPLGMFNTLSIENIDQHIENAALSYTSENDVLLRKRTASCIFGVNSIYSCLNDLVKWEQHLNSPTLLTLESVKKLNELIEFDYQGKTIKSTGTTLGQIGYHWESGAHKSWMRGNSGGFSSSVTKVVHKGFSSYVLANTGEAYTGWVTVRAALITLPDFFVGPTMIDYSKITTLQLDNKELESYCGDYWNEKSGFRRKIVLENDTLRYTRPNGGSTPLLPIENNRFQMMTPGDNWYFLKFSEGKNPYFHYGSREFPEYYKFDAYQPIALNDSKLHTYEGSYIDSIFNVVYDLKIEKDQLTLKNYRIGDVPLTYVQGDTFSSDTQYFTNLKFERNQLGNITGIHLMHNGKENHLLYKASRSND
ncbi:serine hydrolase domain-containing protein [uncultured Croceitalea sp.]|uniref:serine hydrolase domain-containing protein n=1 Tax=uncultured Croceitalea sp. TaxID=1798908 RepID=UPI0033063369